MPPSVDELKRWDNDHVWHAFTQMAEYEPLLIERAEHADPFVQAAALRALRELVIPDALSAALKALRSPAPEVRREGLGVIGYLKAEEALPALLATARDTDPTVRRATMATSGIAVPDT